MNPKIKKLYELITNKKGYNKVKTDNLIKEAYDLILNSDNLRNLADSHVDIWTYFYNNQDKIISNHQLTHELYTIINFILKYCQKQIPENTADDVLEKISIKNKNTLKLIMESNISSEQKIEQLKNHQSLYSSFNYWISSDDSIKVTKEISKKIKDELNEEKVIVITEIIKLLSESFTDLSPKFAKKTLSFISKNITNNLELLENFNHNKYLFILEQYLTKILPLQHFSGTSYKEDEIEEQNIDRIIEYNLKNKDGLLLFIDKLSIEELLQIFDYYIIPFINKIENYSTFDDKTKEAIIYYFLDKFADENNKSYSEENFLHLLSVLRYKSTSSKILDKYFTPNRIEQIIKTCLNVNIDTLEVDEISYLIDNAKDKDGKIFLTNLYEKYKFSNEYIDSDIKEKISEYEEEDKKEIEKMPVNSQEINQKLSSIMWSKTSDKIDFSTVIDTLDKYLNNEIVLNKTSTKVLINSIIRYIQEQLDLPPLKIYYANSKRYKGSFYEGGCILVNENLIKEFLTKENTKFKKLEILTVILHELRHEQNSEFQKKLASSYDNGYYYNELSMVDDKSEIYHMIKEYLLINHLPEYYKNNYYNVSDEISARIFGYDALAKFLETYLPNHLNDIQDDIITMLEKELELKKQQEKENKVIVSGLNNTINFNKTFDSLLLHNPKIIQKIPILNLEYNQDGNPKTFEEIEKFQIEKHKDLIKYIQKNRYPNELPLEKNNYHSK